MVKNRKTVEGQDQTRKRVQVSAQDFVIAWQTSSSADEVAEKLGLTKEVVQTRASQYRKMGIELKEYPRAGRRAINVDELNKIAQQALEAAQKPQTLDVFKHLRGQRD